MHPVAFDFDRAFHPTAVSRSRVGALRSGYADAMSTGVTVSTGPPQTTGEIVLLPGQREAKQ